MNISSNHKRYQRPQIRGHSKGPEKGRGGAWRG